MKFQGFLLLAVVFLMAGCASPLPPQAELKLSVGDQPAGIFPTIIAVTVDGADKRQDSALLVYQIKNDPPVNIEPSDNPGDIVAGQLAVGLKEQGLVVAGQAPIHLRIEVEDLVATVEKPGLLYETKAVSVISLAVDNAGKSLTKRYSKESTRSSATRPDPQELETMLGEQVSKIIEQILSDRAIRGLIRGV